jgi:hypothetical protein
MSDAWPAVIGTISGALIGAGASYANQARQWARQHATRWDTTRREVYGAFLGKSNACHNSLCRVAWQIHPKRARNQHEIDARWREATERYSEATSLQGEVEILATAPTRLAAQIVIDRLGELKDELYHHDRDKTTPKTDRDYDAIFGPLRAEFIRAVRADVKVDI